MAGMDSLKKKIEEQQEVYTALKEGDTSLVCYKEFKNGEWGTDDANYTNRLRLAYYILYEKIDDEDAIEYLFEEELEDRENNSFQGIGTTLQILTWLLKKYDVDHKYADLFQRAKNANFDCACGYDTEGVVEDDFWKNSLWDGIYLAQDMEYKDVMGELVDEWKKGTAEWTSANRHTLIGFNNFLGRDAENEELYKKQLEEAISASTEKSDMGKSGTGKLDMGKSSTEKSGTGKLGRGKSGTKKSGTAKSSTVKSGTEKISDVISAYRDIIQYYLRMQDYGEAFRYCKMVIETTDYGQIKSRRLFRNILEVCFEVTANDPVMGSGLWDWAKAELQNEPQSSWYGNLYTKAIAAAKAVNDPYAEILEKEYRKWRKACGIWI